MKPTLWIWNKYKDVWTNGVYSITREIVERYTWDQVRSIVLKDIGLALPEQKFQLPRKILIEPEWTLLSIEELMEILNAN